MVLTKPNYRDLPDRARWLLPSDFLLGFSRSFLGWFVQSGIRAKTGTVNRPEEIQELLGSLFGLPVRKLFAEMFLIQLLEFLYGLWRKHNLSRYRANSQLKMRQELTAR